MMIKGISQNINCLYITIYLNFKNQGIQGRQMPTQLELQLERKITEIYAHLTALGCQLVEIVPVSKKNYGNIGKIMEIYFEACDSRYQLIQWLIATINPYYDRNYAYRNSYDDNPHLDKIKKLSISLWQLGVMPYSKHTKNLDYTKYIQGLLGLENSVNLIYDLSVLAAQKYSDKKHLELSQYLVGQLVDNKQQLVNPEYDPYGVTFPAKFMLGQDYQNQKKIVEYQYGEIVKELGCLEEENEDIDEWKEDGTKIFEQIQTYKQIFEHKYNKLLQKIIELQPKIVNLGITELPKQHKKQLQNLHKNRMLSISKQFCTTYKQYKNLTTNVHPQNYEPSLQQSKTSLLQELKQINQIYDFM